MAAPEGLRRPKRNLMIEDDGVRAASALPFVL
jgi:hypothetical protein